MLGQMLVALAYSAVGFVLGFTLGHVTREVHEIKESVMGEEHQPEDVRERRARWFSTMPDRILGVVLIVLALSSVSVTFWASTEQRRVADCQARYNDAFTDALSMRTDIAAQDRRALIDLTNTIASPNADTDKILAAVATYNQTLRQSEAERRANPLPAPRPCS